MSKLVAFLGFLAFLLSISKQSSIYDDNGIVWPNVNWNSGADLDESEARASVNWNSGGG